MFHTPKLVSIGILIQLSACSQSRETVYLGEGDGGPDSSSVTPSPALGGAPGTGGASSAQGGSVAMDGSAAGAGGAPGAGGASGSLGGSEASGGSTAVSDSGVGGGVIPAAGGGPLGSGGTPDSGIGENPDAEDSAIVCPVLHEGVDIGITPLDSADAGREAGSYSDPRQAATTLEGVVESVSEGELVVETCSADAACGADTKKHVTIAAPGLDLRDAMQAQALVHIRYENACGPFLCSGSIVVRNLANWNGHTNAHPPSAGDLYVAAYDGGWSNPNTFRSGALEEAPYTWGGELRSECAYRGGGCGSDSPVGIYATRFQVRNSSVSVLLKMGEVAQLPYLDGNLRIRNLRSYVSGVCDDYWNWAHWSISTRF